MIFYYSGTGNSFWAAKELAQRLDVELYSIPVEMAEPQTLQYKVSPGEPVGFVFPIHAWNPPKAVLKFTRAFQLDTETKPYVFAVSTCGDSSGDTMKILEKALSAKNLKLQGRWDVRMPDNYLLMNEVDAPDVQMEKFEQAKKRLCEIILPAIEAKQVHSDLLVGEKSFLRSQIIGFFFGTFGKNTLMFRTTSSCTGCGLCAKACPSATITVKHGKPHWKLFCDQCYGCINRCPVRAIEVGNETVNKGRYCHPDYRKGGHRDEKADLSGNSVCFL